MSSVYTSSSIEDVLSLDRPLVVKCTFDQKKKRITFGSARNCSYEILRQKVRYRTPEYMRVLNVTEKGRKMFSAIE